MDNYTYQHFQTDALERQKKARQANKSRQVGKNKSNNKPKR